jgi:hypothetical protein
MRVAGVWDWGAFLVRLGLGPEFVDVRHGGLSGGEGSFGGIFLGGTGISFFAADWFAFTILASVVVEVHSGDADTGAGHEDKYFDSKSLEVEVSGGATFYM